MDNVCNDCPMRLFNKKHYNLQGIGDPFSGNLIVIPNVDYTAYKKGNLNFSKQVDVIKSLNTDIINNFYIVPFIRCNETISCDVNDDIYNRCLHHLAVDISKYNFKNILLLGDAARRFFNISIKDNLDNLFISRNNRYYFVNFSPYLLLTDNIELANIFKSRFIKWVNAVLNKDFKEYIVCRC